MSVSKMTISKRYVELLDGTTSDNIPAGASSIYQHLPKLKNIAKLCSSVAEVGVEEVISTYALAQGLTENEEQNIE